MIGDLLKGFYWNTKEEEYNVQVTFNSETRSKILDIFEDWTKVAEGIDLCDKKEILIFRKNFELRSQFLNLAKELRKKQIIFLKEAK